MYVCVCNAVPDRAIVRAIDRGVATLDGLMAELGVATACGSCEEAVRQMLSERLRVLGLEEWVVSAA